MAVMPSAVVACDEIYVQLSAFADKFAEFQRSLNENVVIRSVTKLPSKWKQSLTYVLDSWMEITLF